MVEVDLSGVKFSFDYGTLYAPYATINITNWTIDSRDLKSYCEQNETVYAWLHSHTLNYTDYCLQENFEFYQSQLYGTIWKITFKATNNDALFVDLDAKSVVVLETTSY